MKKELKVNYAKRGWIWLAIPLVLYLILILLGFLLDKDESVWYILMLFFVLSIASIIMSLMNFFKASLKINRLYLILVILLFVLLLILIYFGLLAYKI